MKKITLELDDGFADVLCITAIGQGGGYCQNVFTTAINLVGVRDRTVLRMELTDGDITKPVLLPKKEWDRQRRQKRDHF